MLCFGTWAYVSRTTSFTVNRAKLKTIHRHPNSQKVTCTLTLSGRCSITMTKSIQSNDTDVVSSEPTVVSARRGTRKRSIANQTSKSDDVGVDRSDEGDLVKKNPLTQRKKKNTISIDTNGSGNKTNDENDNDGVIGESDGSSLKKQKGRRLAPTMRKGIGKVDSEPDDEIIDTQHNSVSANSEKVEVSSPRSKSDKEKEPTQTERDNDDQNKKKAKKQQHQILTERDDLPKLWNEQNARANGSYSKWPNFAMFASTGSSLVHISN